MKKLFFFVCLFICRDLNSQTLTVRDINTREGISDVMINDRNNNTVITDAKGNADIGGLDKGGVLSLNHPSYPIMQFSITPGASSEIYLHTKYITLDEVVLSANRTKENKIDVPYQIEVINQKNIEFLNQPNTGDLLASTGNIALQKSQLGGGSPNLRGFEASRVLIVLDGVRMNNAIYRAGHLQDVMTLDAQMLERTEVIFGPSSTIYGSDALGGVMHFYTKSPAVSTGTKMRVNVNAMMRYGSANDERSGHFDLNLGWKKFASLTNVTHSQFGDLRSGKNKLPGFSDAWDRRFYVQRINERDSMVSNPHPNILVGTGYRQTDLMQRFSFHAGNHLVHNLNFQLSMNPDLPRFDRLAGDYSGGSLRWAENRYTQNRRFAAYSFNYNDTTSFSDNIRFIAAYQDIDQQRIMRRYRNNYRVSQFEKVAVISVNLDITKSIGKKHELRYGAELTDNDVRSAAETHDIINDSVFRADTRYAALNAMNTRAAYLSHAYEVNNNFVVNSGIRFTATSLVSEFRDTLPFKFPFTTAEQNSRALTGSLGFTRKMADNYKFSLLVNTGFRAPNVDDMSKMFESGPVMIVANPEIKPEYAYNLEMGISKIIGTHFKFDLTAYYTVVENYLSLRDFRFNGEDSISYNGTKLKVQAMQNTDWSNLIGFNAGFQVEPGPNLVIRSTINYIYGRYNDVLNDTVVPLDHIPPVFGLTGINYRRGKLELDFFARYSGKKVLSEYSPSGEDNLQYATADGMPGWYTLNVRSGYNLTKYLRLNIACENITDVGYRTFASGINSPGRNFIISLRCKF
jgi:hemoglobin/transferrin/lactoferrin receptor protein